MKRILVGIVSGEILLVLCIVGLSTFTDGSPLRSGLSAFFESVNIPLDFIMAGSSFAKQLSDAQDPFLTLVTMAAWWAFAGAFVAGIVSGISFVIRRTRRSGE